MTSSTEVFGGFKPSVTDLKARRRPARPTLATGLRISFLYVSFLAAGFIACPLAAASLSPTETLTLFPTLANQTSDGQAWELQIHGWVYQLETRNLTVEVLRRMFSIEERLDGHSQALFADRTRLFLANSRSGRRVTLQVAQANISLPKSRANGHVNATCRLSAEWLSRFPSITNDPRAPLTLLTPPTDNHPHGFSGQVFLIPPTGISIISDIDDTIKISDVQDKRALLRNTFCRPFVAVPGMASTYRAWADQAHAQFHYVSASPWQLYPPLSGFLEQEGFPAGTYHLKNFRLNDTSFLNLFESPEQYKKEMIQPLLKRFPKRRFVLVGDSTEKDPEAYGWLARQYPDQIKLILIRNLSLAHFNSNRYQKAFAKIPRQKWRLFERPEEIQDAVP
jgi:hypothetical protein